MPCAPREFIEAEHTVVGPRHLTPRGHLAPTDQPHIGNSLVGGATRPGGDERAAPPGRPATRGRRVVSRASTRVISGRVVVMRRASLDVPALGLPSMRTL
jgi:hypothetical protein